MYCRILHLLTLFGCVCAQTDFISLLKSQADYSIFLNTINLVPGLATTLNNLRGVTILAPSNQAFNSLDPASPAAVAIRTKDVPSVEALMNYHVLKGLHPTLSMRYSPRFAHTLLSNQFEFDGAIAAKVTAGQYVGILLVGKVITMISGGIAISTVTLADTKINGIIVHKMDSLLTLPGLCSDTAGNFGLNAMTGALTTASRAATIDGLRDVTVFVPSNEAFEAVGSVINKVSKAKLQQILEYHVIPGSIIWSPTISNETVKSYEGTDIDLSSISGNAFINTAHIVIPNIPLLNGVAHVIDAVLNPEAPPIDREALAHDPDPTPAWSNAKSATKVPFASVAPDPDTTLAVPAIATTARGVEVGFSSTPMSGALPTFAPGEVLLGAGVAALAALAL